jgi:SpoVK/Ycf46/Vps4 family AAA+-type ATPase
MLLCRARTLILSLPKLLLTSCVVFLRILEFYTGILFLTTNRVGALDEAIKSRITWISYYPPLNLNQTKEIWKTNIRRTKNSFSGLEVDNNNILRFAKKQYKESIRLGMPKSEIWNGRKIQNAFKVAMALAYWDACTEEDREQTKLLDAASAGARRAKLTSAHFAEYARDARAFDDYVRGATGFDESARAFQTLERNDDWEDEDQEQDIGQSGPSVPELSPITAREPRRMRSASNIQPSHTSRPASPNARPSEFPR